MPSPEFHAHYWSAIGVLAIKFGIKLERLSMGDEAGLGGRAALEPLEDWCDLEGNLDTYKSTQIESYVTTLLAGLAGNFIYVRDARCGLKRSLGDAGLELQFVRKAWQCLQAEPDRAVAIICGSLGQHDDGDAEATMHRLGRRAVDLLERPPQRKQLQRLAKALVAAGQLTELEIVRVLKAK